MLVRGLISCSALTDKLSEASILPSVTVMAPPAEQKSPINHGNCKLAASVGKTITTVFPLSESAQDLLQAHTHEDSIIQPQFLSINLTNLTNMIESSQVIWQSEVSSSRAVIRCSENIVAKIFATSKITLNLLTCSTLRNTLQKSQHQGL